MYCAAVIQKNIYPADSVVLFSCFSGFMNKFLNRYVKPTLSHETLSKHKIFLSLLGKNPRVGSCEQWPPLFYWHVFSKVGELSLS